jgi:preprotein translocase subunit YajC
MRAQQSMLSAVEEGDEILTTAGVYGFITAMDGDMLWVEIAEGVEVRVAKGAVARRVTAREDLSDAPASAELDAAPDAKDGDETTRPADDES